MQNNYKEPQNDYKETVCVGPPPIAYVSFNTFLLIFKLTPSLPFILQKDVQIVKSK